MTKADITRLPVSFVVIDNRQLTDLGVRNLLRRKERLMLATSDPRHAATAVDDPRPATLPTDGRRQLADLGMPELAMQSVEP